MEFALVDIETTGGYSKGHGITEIAILIVKEGRITNRYHRLINPARSIPETITAITGITNDTVVGAKPFSTVAEEVATLLQGRIFVAHNVNFDFAFIKSHLELCNRQFAARRFCTLRYAKMVKPGLPSYSLDNLCRLFGISNVQKHRAMGDALAMFDLIEHLKKEDHHGHFEDLLKFGGHKNIIPSHIPEEEISELPEQPGVYYLLNQQKKPIYIGKAKNLRHRVLSHFTSITKSSRRQLFQKEVWSVKYKTVLSETQALLLEDQEIKQYWPKYNRAQKRSGKMFGVVLYKNRLGDERLGIMQNAQGDAILARFGSIAASRQWLNQLVVKYGFNPKRAGVSSIGYMPPADEKAAFDHFLEDYRKETTGSYLVVEPPVDGKRPFILMENGKYKGFADFPDGDEDPWRYTQEITRTRETPESQAIIRRLLQEKEVVLIRQPGEI